jgi:hypothetical protein
MNVLENYFSYWDKWHVEWKNSNYPILGDWPEPILAKNIDQEFPVKEYFPEPYYCKNPKNKIDAIFLSINPGKGKLIQHIKNGSSNLISHYNTVNSYSSSVNKLLEESEGTKRFFEHREKLTRDLTKKEDVNILCADLVPWHTPSQSDIKDYIVNNISNVKKNVVIPLMKIAQDGSITNNLFLNKIIVRGTSFRDTLNDVIPKLFSKFRLNKVKDEIKYFAIAEAESSFVEQYSTFLAIVTLNKIKFFIFTGGQGMYIPQPNKIAYPINCKSEKLQTIEELLTE